jgi:hypothetical protein
MTSGTEAAVLGLVGALIGSLSSTAVAVVTLRLTQRAENQRRAGDRVWQVESEVRDARRSTYTRFLDRQNAIIVSAGEVASKARRRRAFTEMPDSMRPVYEELQNAWAESLLLAGPRVREYLKQTQGYLDQLVWKSWEGETLDPRDRLFEDLLDAMQGEITGSSQG